MQTQPSCGSSVAGLETLWKAYIRQYVLPTLFVVCFPCGSVAMALYPLEGGLSRFHLGLLLGNGFSWATTLLLTAWALASLKIPSKVYRGPATAFGQVPEYSANGFGFYCCTVAAFVLLTAVRPSLAVAIYGNMPQILGNLFLVASLLCCYLWYVGKYRPAVKEQREDLPVIFEFYRGMEVHPRVWGVDVKQLTNCRMGLAAWQLLVLAFWFTSLRENGFNGGTAVNALLQSVYLAKFYWWETGYFTTLDITMDRAGFYICCGCLAIVPTIYTYSTYYFVSHPPVIGSAASAAFFALGSLSIYLNYQIDHQKQRFRETNGQCTIWGRKPEYIQATRWSADRKTKKSTQLLVSGYWGVARHLNYVFELLLSLFWNLPGWGMGPAPFVYNVFLTILLVHRIYRDEDKCEHEYGASWKKYCEVVPYRLLPYIY